MLFDGAMHLIRDHQQLSFSILPTNTRQKGEKKAIETMTEATGSSRSPKQRPFGATPSTSAVTGGGGGTGFIAPAVPPAAPSPPVEGVQASVHRSAQPVRYPGYDPHRVHALPMQNQVRLDHLRFVRQVIFQNRENLTRFGVAKEMTRLLHRKSIQKFMLDSFWWFFLDCFAGVNLDVLVERAQRNNLVSESEMRAYLNPLKERRGTMRGVGPNRYRHQHDDGDDDSDDGDDEKSDDELREETKSPGDGTQKRSALKEPSPKSKRAESEDDVAMSVARLLGPGAKRPVHVSSSDEDEEEEEDPHVAEDRRKRREKKVRKVRTSKEDFAPPTHLNTLKAKNRRAEDIALVGSPRSPSVEALSSLIRANSDSSEWSDSSDSTTSLAYHSSHDDGQSTFTPPASSLHLPGDSLSPTALEAISEAEKEAAERKAKNIAFAEVTCPRSRLLARQLMRVKNFHTTTYNLHRMEPTARRSIIQSEQHQLFTRMAHNYGSTIQKLSRRLHYSLKDGITRLLPEIMAQLMFLFFHRAIPFATHYFDTEFQQHLWSTCSFWFGGVHRHGNVKGWPIHVLVDPLLAHKVQVKAMLKAEKESKGLGAIIGAGGGGGVRSNIATTGQASFAQQRRESRFSLGSGDSTTIASKWGMPSSSRTNNTKSRFMTTPKKPGTAAPDTATTTPASRGRGGGGGGRKTRGSTTTAEQQGVVVQDAPQPQPPAGPPGRVTRLVSRSSISSLAAGGASTATTDYTTAGQQQQQPSTGGQLQYPLSPAEASGGAAGSLAVPNNVSLRRASTSTTSTCARRPSNVAAGASTTLHPHPPSATAPLASTTRAPSSAALGTTSIIGTTGGASGGGGVGDASGKFDAVGAFFASSSRAQMMVNRDVELMKTELHRLRTTHTFSQAHYSSSTGGGGAMNPTRQSTTKSAPAVEGKDAPPSAGGGGGGEEGGVVERTKFTYQLNAGKRTVQVIKAELDAKYKAAVPWYGSSKRRVPIKEHLGACKFSVRNWSPLVHRYLLGCGEDNKLPSDGMTWTLPSESQQQ